LQTQLQTTIHFGHGKFFRQQLLRSNPGEISELIDNMEKDCQTIRQEALKISWFMRGGITYDQTMALGIQERNLINEIITDNLETTKKSGLPFF
jgi:hypothetical protein